MHRVRPVGVARLARVREHRDAVPVGDLPVVVEAGLAPASPAGRSAHVGAAASRAMRRARGTGRRARPDGPVASTTRSPAAAARRSRSAAGAHASTIGSGRISTGPLRASRSIGAPAARSTRSRTSSSVRPSCRPVSPNSLSGSWSSSSCAFPRTLSSGWVAQPATSPASSARSSSSRSTGRGVHAARSSRRQTADVGFDNVGRHRPGSLTRGTGWTCGTRSSW